MTGSSYGSPSSFRRALTDMLKALAATSRWALPQLQRQMAYDRILERLYLVDGGWIVKGATALLAREIGVRAIPPAFTWGAMGLLDGGSLAYLTRRPGRPGRSQLGACGYGPARERLVSAYADRIRAFSQARPRTLRVEVRPLSHAPVPTALMQIDKKKSRIIVLAEDQASPAERAELLA